jgi:DNA repair exonuclease SbcCD ATPase subunit
LTDAEPQILDVYQEIELRASLLGREPDIMYSKRLQHSSKDEDVLLRCFVDSLRMPSEILELKRYLADRDIALREALEELKTQSNEIKTLRELQISLKDSHRLELEKLLKEQESKHTVHQQELADLRQQYEPQLLDLRQCLNDRETELQEARGEGELTITQLHHVQEELEVFFLSDQDKQKQLEEQAKAIQTLTETQDTLKKTHRKELEKLRKGQETKHSVHQQELADLSQQFDAKLVDLQSQLNDRETELRDAREEAELTVAQLHQVQEELENYFLMSRAGEQLIQAQDEQLQRAQRLLARLQKQGSLSMANPPAMTVEVLPSRPRTASGAMSLQTEALLSAYGASLRRANELLTRAKRL